MRNLSVQDEHMQELTTMMKYAQFVANSTLIPRELRGKPGDIVIAMQIGKEIGLKPMQSLQSIAVINGRPCIYGDALAALIKVKPDFEYMKEYEKDKTATCIIKRKGQPECVQTFSRQDAVIAGLANRTGPWKTYPRRMRQMRARAFAIRDCYPDAMKGLSVAEEVRDYDVKIEQKTEAVVKEGSSIEAINDRLKIEHKEDDGDDMMQSIIDSINTSKTKQELLEAITNIEELTEEQKTSMRTVYKEKLTKLQEVING